MIYTRILQHFVALPYMLLAMVEFVLLMSSVDIVYRAYDPSISSIWLGNSELFARAFSYAAIMLLVMVALGVYGVRAYKQAVGIWARSLACLCLLGMIGVKALGVVRPDWVIHSQYDFNILLLSLCFIGISRLVFLKLTNGKYLRKNVVVYGAGKQAQDLIQSLEEHGGNIGVHIVGCIDAGDEAVSVDKALLLECPTNWAQFMRTHGVSEIVIATNGPYDLQGAAFPLDQLLDCKQVGVDVLEIVRFYQRELGIVEFSCIKPSWMLSAKGFYSSRIRNAIKVFFDVTVSLTVLLLLWPVLALIALAIYLESGAPIFYTQKRTGRNGVSFDMYKFRSMHLDASRETKASWTEENDPRITRVGRIIRPLHLDELPQLYNILKGDMSFVGPRPEQPDIDQQLQEVIPYYKERYRVKPGISGWAQLNFRYGATTSDAAEKLRYDLYYTKNHSILLDLLIVIQTIGRVLIGTGSR